MTFAIRRLMALFSIHFLPYFFLLWFNLIHMKRILHLVPIKNVILKWFKIDIFRLLRPLTAKKKQKKNNIYLFVFKHNSSSKSHIEQISIENLLVVTTISGPRNRLPRLLWSGSQSHFATTKRSKLTSFSRFCFYVEKGDKTDSEIRAFTCIPPNTKRIDLCSYLAMMCLAGDLFSTLIFHFDTSFVSVCIWKTTIRSAAPIPTKNYYLHFSFFSQQIKMFFIFDHEIFCLSSFSWTTISKGSKLP